MRREEDWRASQLLVEREMFPENRRVKKNMRISLEREIEKLMLQIEVRERKCSPTL